MRFHKLDLNLLVALDALLQERSVGLASERLHLSQSATSNALGRLRDYFQDELLVLQGRQMALTPRAEELVAPVHAVLEQIRQTIAVAQPFDPVVSDRTIRIMASDYVLDVLLRPALVAFEDEAPNMVFEVAALGDDIVEELQRGRAELLITIETVISTELPHTPLFEDDYVVVGWSGNRELIGGITREIYETLGHVAVRFGRLRIPTAEEWFLKNRQIQRRIEVVAPSFGPVAGLIVDTQRIATMHRKHAERMARVFPLKIMELPFSIPGIRSMAQWSQPNANDPALMWLVSRLRELAKDLSV